MGKSCDKARACDDQESWNLAITRSRAERKGLYGSEGKESGSRFGPSEDKVSLPCLRPPNRVPGFSGAVQVPRDVLVKQSTLHPSDPDCQGDASLNLASGAALERSPLQITPNNGGAEHVSTVRHVHSLAFPQAPVAAESFLEGVVAEHSVVAATAESELVKEAFSDPCFLKQVCGLEAMFRVSSGSADTAHAAAGASTGIIGLLEGMDSDASENRANVIATSGSVAVTGATAGESEGTLDLLGCLSLSFHL